MPPTNEPPHSHVFDLHNPVAERRTRQVMWLTAVMMVVEIAAGTLFGSMALLADGWHMSSHALALGVSAGAYALARRHAHDPRFTFGTWKIEVLGGYTSAVFLLGVAGYMGFESVARLVEPSPIRFDEAIPIAVIGLGVNVLSAWLLSTGSHQHDHHHAGGRTRPRACATRSPSRPEPALRLPACPCGRRDLGVCDRRIDRRPLLRRVVAGPRDGHRRHVARGSLGAGTAA